MTARALRLACLVLLLGSHAEAQSLNPGPPGPFVIDLRGATSGLPVDVALYPDHTGTTTSSTSTTTSTESTSFNVPSRGWGFDVGAHFYPFSLGPTRVGFGASFMEVRGTAADAELVMQVVAPQLSFNFGTSNGWSYLSAGFGPARLDADRTFNTQAINAGGGARWFLNNHLAIGFDIRGFQLAATGAFPKTTKVAVSAGLSLK
ncbi:MAG TPA: hypothetical protein VKB50_05470 [Vicinamibacterales bacterium]|nr:hypothetical protein [Vicinamibacterales bacterium]